MYQNRNPICRKLLKCLALKKIRIKVLQDLEWYCVTVGHLKTCFYFGGNGPTEREVWTVQERKVKERRAHMGE